MGALVDELLFLRAGGVEMKKSCTCALPVASARGFLGVIVGPLGLAGLTLTGDGPDMFSFDKARGSGDEKSNSSSGAMLQNQSKKTRISDAVRNDLLVVAIFHNLGRQ